jgi:hypothetical protein
VDMIQIIRLGMYRIQYKINYPLDMSEIREGKKWISAHPLQWQP